MVKGTSWIFTWSFKTPFSKKGAKVGSKHFKGKTRIKLDIKPS